MINGIHTEDPINKGLIIIVVKDTFQSEYVKNYILNFKHNLGYSFEVRTVKEHKTLSKDDNIADVLFTHIVEDKGMRELYKLIRFAYGIDVAIRNSTLTRRKIKRIRLSPDIDRIKDLPYSPNVWPDEVSIKPNETFDGVLGRVSGKICGKFELLPPFPFKLMTGKRI